MLLALVAAVVSVALGAALAVAGGGRAKWLGPTRTFALVTSVAVVVATLLPAALTELGVVAFGLFALGLLVPPIFERMATVRRDVVGLEMGYLGLVLHKAGDGLALGTYTSELHAGHGHLELVVAIAAHTVPVVALVSVVFVARRGVRTALVRASILAVVAAAGVVSTRVIPTEALSDAEPWITAVVAGMLLHVVFHDWKLVRGDGSPVSRRLGDGIALIAGAAIFLVGGHDHHGDAGGGGVRELAAAAGLDLLLTAAPWLLVGLVAGALLQTFASRVPMGWLLSGSRTRQALRGSVVGAPVPVCACVVLPVAQSLRARGAGAALVAAFLWATPGLGVETFALTARFLGWPLAVVRLGATVLIAFAGALLVGWLARRGEARTGEPIRLTGELDEPEGSGLARLLAHFDELLHHVGPWTVVMVVAASLVQAVLDPDALAPLAGTGLDVLVVSALAAPSYVCAAAVTPLAFVLLAKGLSPAAVLAGLLLGPLLNLSTVGFLRGAYGTRAAFAGVVVLVALAVAISVGFDVADLPSIAARPLPAGAGSHGLVDWAATAALGLFVVASVWRHGLRRWLGGLGEPWSAEEHRHNHGHARDTLRQRKTS